MKQMVATEQIQDIKTDKEIKDLAWDSVSEDHAQDLVEPIVNVVNYGIEQGLIQAGGKYYLHTIRATRNDSNYIYMICFNVVSSSNEAFTKNNVPNGKYLSCGRTFVSTGGSTNNGRVFYCEIGGTDSNKSIALYGSEETATTPPMAFNPMLMGGTLSLSSVNFIDEVTEIS